MLNVFIPTRARAALRRATWHTVPQSHNDVYVVVRPDETAMYRKIPHIGQMLVLPEKVQGISATRQWILRYAMRNDMRYVAMLDDDITGLNVKATCNKYGTLRRTPDSTWRSVFRWMEETLEYGAGFAALSGRMQSAFPTKYFYYLNARLAWKAWAIDVEKVRQAKARFDRVTFGQDVDMQVQLVRAGYDSVVTTKYSYNALAERSDGGCETYRTDKKIRTAFTALARLHAPYLTFRERTDKHDQQQFSLKVDWSQLRDYHGLGGSA